MSASEIYSPKLFELPITPADASHRNEADLPWVEMGLDIKMKLLSANDKTGTWISLYQFPAGLVLPKHRHSGCVVAYTLQGKWCYLENDFVATKGSMIQETANSAHTLSVDADNTEPTIVFFVVEGSLTHYDENGNVWGIDDAQTMLQRYLELSAAQDTPVKREQVAY